MNNPQKLFNSKGYGLALTFLFILILSSFCVIGASNTYWEYPSQSGYAQERTYFNDNFAVDDATIYSKSLTNPIGMPLYSDLDGDGVIELVVQDGQSIKLYSSNTLTTIDTYSLLSASYKYPYIYDIDNDGFNEILIVEQRDQTTADIDIIEYNGTNVYSQTSFTLVNIAGSLDGYSIGIGCANSDQCIFTAGFEEVTNTITRTYYGSFNSTGVIRQATNINNDAVKRASCINFNHEIEVTDYDLDGQLDYITSYAQIGITSGTQNEIQILRFKQNITNVYFDDETKILTGYNQIFNISLDCDLGGYSKVFSGTLTDNFDNSNGNGEETIIGVGYSNTTFKMYSYGGLVLMALLDTYPNAVYGYTGVGEVLSNVFKATIFSDTGILNDFCVFGFPNSTSNMGLLCATMDTGNTFDTQKFSETGVFPSLPLINNKFYRNVYSTDSSSDEIDFMDINPSDFVTYKGMLKIDSYQFLLDSINDISADIDSDWEVTTQPSSTILCDLEKAGRNDICSLTANNVWVYDDGYTNSQAYLDSYIMNPCFDSTWLENTTAVFTAKVNDDDDSNDYVEALGILYDETPYNQSTGWSGFYPSGTSIPLSFVANETIASGTLKIYVHDTKHNTTNVSYSYPISVSSANGVSFGECISSAEVNITTNETAIVNNSITSFIDSLDDNLGLGIGGTALWYILMLFLGAMIIYWGYSQGLSPITTSISFGVIEILMLYLGILFGYIGIGTIITIIVIGALLVLLKFNFGQNNNQGV